MCNIESISTGIVFKWQILASISDVRFDSYYHNQPMQYVVSRSLKLQWFSSSNLLWFQCSWWINKCSDILFQYCTNVHCQWNPWNTFEWLLNQIHITCLRKFVWKCVWKCLLEHIGSYLLYSDLMCQCSVYRIYNKSNNGTCTAHLMDALYQLNPPCHSLIKLSN